MYVLDAFFDASSSVSMSVLVLSGVPLLRLHESVTGCILGIRSVGLGIAV